MKRTLSVFGLILFSLVALAPPAFGVGVFIAGFAATSGGANPGMHRMSEATEIGGLIPGDHFNLAWNDDHDAVIEKIRQARANNPDEPVVLIGHSLGATAAVEMAFTLKRFDIDVDVLVQLESIAVVSSTNETTPGNVKHGFNLWSTFEDTLNGLSQVDGSRNIGIDGTNHADIDEPDDVGTSSDPDFEGKNAWGIIHCVLMDVLGGGG